MSDSSPVSESSVQDVADPDDYSFLYGLVNAPCFRETALYSIGGGAILGALRFQKHRDPMRSAETMVKSGTAFAMIHWVICRKRYYDEREKTYETLEKLKKKQADIAKYRAQKAAREKITESKSET